MSICVDQGLLFLTLFCDSIICHHLYAITINIASFIFRLALLYDWIVSIPSLEKTVLPVFSRTSLKTSPDSQKGPGCLKDYCLPLATFPQATSSQQCEAQMK